MGIFFFFPLHGDQQEDESSRTPLVTGNDSLELPWSAANVCGGSAFVTQSRKFRTERQSRLQLNAAKEEGQG